MPSRQFSVHPQQPVSLASYTACESTTGCRQPHHGDCMGPDTLRQRYHHMQTLPQAGPRQLLQSQCYICGSQPMCGCMKKSCMQDPATTAAAASLQGVMTCTRVQSASGEVTSSHVEPAVSNRAALAVLSRTACLANTEAACKHIIQKKAHNKSSDQEYGQQNVQFEKPHSHMNAVSSSRTQQPGWLCMSSLSGVTASLDTPVSRGHTSTKQVWWQTTLPNS